MLAKNLPSTFETSNITIATPASTSVNVFMVAVKWVDLWILWDIRVIYIACVSVLDNPSMCILLRKQMLFLIFKIDYIMDTLKKIVSKTEHLTPSH